MQYLAMLLLFRKYKFFPFLSITILSSLIPYGCVLSTFLTRVTSCTYLICLFHFLSLGSLLSRYCVVSLSYIENRSHKQLFFGPAVLRLLHDVPLAAHPGRDKTLQTARKQYYWLILCSDVEKHLLECVTCAANKGHVPPPAPMLNYPTPPATMDVIAKDLLQLPPSHQG